MLEFVIILIIIFKSLIILYWDEQKITNDCRDHGYSFRNEALVLLFVSPEIEFKHILHTMKFNEKFPAIVSDAFLKSLASMNIKK